MKSAAETFYLSVTFSNVIFYLHTTHDIVLDAISTKLNPNAIATQVAKSVIVCSRSICIFPLTHAYIT